VLKNLCQTLVKKTRVFFCNRNSILLNAVWRSVNKDNKAALYKNVTPKLRSLMQYKVLPPRFLSLWQAVGAFPPQTAPGRAE
jgi:hypothetical protein